MTSSPPYFPLSNYNKILLGVVVVKALLITALILFGSIGLSPDEAQYYTWSQMPAAGYYSKPPGIAYQILLGTSIFGSNEFGVRFGSLVIGMMMPFLIFRLGQKSGLSEEGSFWAGMMWALSPLGFIGSFLAITDGGMIVCWTLAAIIYLKQGPSLLLGLVIALGALFKWPIYLFWFFVLADQIFLIHAKKRDVLEVIQAFLISLLGFIPSIIWNYENDFATFKHVGATLQGGSGAQKAPGNFWEFLGSQVALMTPIFFIFMVLSYKKRNPANVFSHLLTLPLIFTGLVLSLFMKVQGNWAVVAFPTAMVLAATVAIKHKYWLYAGLAFSLFAVLAIFLFVPLKHNMGWNKLPAILKEVGYDPEHDFLVSDKYQNTSILSFYSLGQKRAYFLNLKGDRLNQFSFWPSLKDEQLHQQGFFITFDQEEPNLTPYFEKVEKVGTFSLAPKKNVTLYKTTYYNGTEPGLSSKY